MNGQSWFSFAGLHAGRAWASATLVHLVMPKRCMGVLSIFDPFLVPKQPFLGFSEGQNGPLRGQNVPKTLVLAFHVVQYRF